MILVTAANGNQGKLLIPKLLATQTAIRACVASVESARALRATGVSDVVVGDITEPDVLARAVAGVEKIYHVGPALHPREKTMGFDIIDAACAAGVRHFVFSSVLHPILTDLVQHEVKRDIEEHLNSSGLPFTILQPANFMLRHRLDVAFERSVYPLAWALERYQSMVALDDVTDVAATALLDSDRHAGATYELVSPGTYTAHDLARIVSDVVGREVRAERISPEVFLQGMVRAKGPGDHSYEERALRAISARYSTHDFIGNANVLTWLLGRNPTTFEQFVRREFDHFNASRSAT